MAYNPTNWQNLPNTTTPLYDVNLKKIENKLSDLDTNMIELQGHLHFIPQFTGLIGDNSVQNININSSLEGFYLFINSHINLREVYIITFYSNIGLKVDTIYRNSDAQGSTTFSISGNTLTINGAINCRGQLYYVPQMLANN